jgi:hypothetical protein
MHRVRNDTGDVTTRYWLTRPDKSSVCIRTTVLWAMAGEPYLRERLKELGIHLRWFDILQVGVSRYGFRDIYITSSILEKLYASD